MGRKHGPQRPVLACCLGLTWTAIFSVSSQDPPLDLSMSQFPLLFLFLFFGHTTQHVGIFIPQPGIKPASPSLEAWTPEKPPPLLIRTAANGVGPILIQFELNDTCKDYLQIRSHSQVRELGLEHILWWGTQFYSVCLPLLYHEEACW